jgi:hypothetical protein
MQGGARPLPNVDAHELVLGILLGSVAVYAESFPAALLRFADSIFGRVLLFTAVFFAATYGGWVLGLLAAVAAARMFQYVPRMEGFMSEFEVRVIPEDSKKHEVHRWYNERVLGEHPYLYESNVIESEAVQGFTGRAPGALTGL